MSARQGEVAVITSSNSTEVYLDYTTLAVNVLSEHSIASSLKQNIALLKDFLRGGNAYIEKASQ